MKKESGYELPMSPDAGTVYRLLPQKEGKFLYENRIDRNIGWITEGEQMMLREKVVGIAGCGGMGGTVANVLLRLGIGEIRIADTETFDLSNLNRQYAATRSTLGLSKACETAKMLRQIASDTTIEVYPMGISEKSVEEFVKGCDIICDEIEFWAVGARILLHRVAQKHGISVLNSPTVGHRVYVFKFTPQSLQIEDVLKIDYNEAWSLQAKIQTHIAKEDDIKRVMDAMVMFAAPEGIPEYSLNPERYSTENEVRQRLRIEQRASIIATNPPMASGFLCNHVLFHLLEEYSTIKRHFVLPPPMPGYVVFDAATLYTKRHEGAWW